MISTSNTDGEQRLYDGRVYLGAIKQRGNRFEAVLPTGDSVGIGSKREAVTMLLNARPPGERP